jgi:hypothetical protein
MRLRRSSALCRTVGAVATLFAIIGCQSVNPELAKLGDMTASPAKPLDEHSVEEGRKFFVEFREKGKQPQIAQIALPDVLYVQQALEQSGALGRFRRMKIEIYRHLPNGGGHRLDIPFDRAKRSVPPSGDYAIHPNDRIVVTEDTSTMVDDMLESLGGPFSKGK